MNFLDQLAESYTVNGKRKERALPKERNITFPQGQEAAFFYIISGLLAELKHDLTEQIEREKMLAVHGDSLNNDGLDRWLASVDGYKNLINRKFETDRITNLLRGFQKSFLTFNKKQVEKSYEKFAGVDLLAYGDDIIDTVKANTASSVASIKEIGDDIKAKLEKQVYRGMTEGLRSEELTKRLLRSLKGEKGLIGKAKSKAKLIARNEVSSFNGALTKKRNENLGIKFYQWQAIDDSRVRKEGGRNGKPSKVNHLAFNGHIFPWGNSAVKFIVDGITYKFKPAPKGIFGATMYPGSEINCRCVAKAVLNKRLEQRIRKLAKTKSPKEVVRELQGF